MLRMAMIVLTGVLLAGCQGGEDGTMEDEGQAQAAPSLDAEGSTAEPPFFVGKWAAEEELCENAAWEFSSTRIETPGHVLCTFEEEVKHLAEIYEVDATCTAEGPPKEHRLKISYAQSAGALLVEGAPFQPVGLVACR